MEPLGGSRLPSASMATDSSLVRFYLHAGPDHAGRSLRDIRRFDPARLEATHDFIQWLFPLPEPSGANPLAPQLVAADIAAFGTDERLRDELRSSLDLMLAFYGLRRGGTPEAPRIERAADYAARSAEWLSRPHNFLRISRILRCLTLLGCAAEARAFLPCLEEIARENPQAVPADTLRHWRRAVVP
jgi:hypothetical protein